MQMPRPTSHHEELDRLVGRWVGEETMHPSPWNPKGSTAKGFIDAHRGLEGMHLLTSYRQEQDGHVTYRGHGVYGWDEKSGLYTMYWFDSMGFDPGGPARGPWEGDVLQFQMAGERGHSRYTYHFQDADTFVFTIDMSQDGTSWQRWLDSTWRRV